MTWFGSLRRSERKAAGCLASQYNSCDRGISLVRGDSSWNVGKGVIDHVPKKYPWVSEISVKGSSYYSYSVAGILPIPSESSPDKEDSTRRICRSSRMFPRMAPFLRKHFCRCSIAESWRSSPHPRGRDLLSFMPSEFLSEVILLRTDVSDRRSSPA